MNYKPFNRRSRSMRVPRNTYRPNRRANRRHIGRVIAYLVLTPIVTWYAHQKYTNPFKFYPNIAFDFTTSSPQIQLYDTNHKDTINRVHIVLDTQAVQSSHGTMKTNDRIHIANTPKLDGLMRDSVYTFLYGNKNIAIAFGTKPIAHPVKEIDILVLSKAACEHAQLWRTTMAPRLTVTFEPSSQTVPINFKTIKRNEWFQVVEGPYKTLELTPK